MRAESALPSSTPPRAIGIVAGAGPLPSELAGQLQRQGVAVFVVALEGFADERLLAPYPHCTVRLGAVGALLAALRQHHCRDVVLIGPIKRPHWRAMRPDATGALMLARLGKAIWGGDDHLLRAVVKLLEGEGFWVRGAHEFLASHVGDPGQQGRHSPDQQAMADMRQAARINRALAAEDIGQGCVVRKGQVLAVEALEGTDAMLARCQGLVALAGGVEGERAGLLYKSAKHGQDIRVDMPALGPETIRGAAKAGLAGVGYEAGSTLLIAPDETSALADRLGLFLYGLQL
ncbi:DUF1009 domain-containing protein [Formicincola oecophyllae]|uniref:DUF1009 domain-containing protein n=1 Tax=Formicincola oecophyllae TaxID=2558361 RepID=A0A4Y6UAB5_9PROT|nr:UDP-2,3-diacylglucosamine diphosphatase LpxI [Formicincola oecophyllae]QDH13890.1 DUF1009 domain-containing protein [Formicincola oecophyllae]